MGWGPPGTAPLSSSIPPGPSAAWPALPAGHQWTDGVPGRRSLLCEELVRRRTCVQGLPAGTGLPPSWPGAQGPGGLSPLSPATACSPGLQHPGARGRPVLRAPATRTGRELLPLPGGSRPRPRRGDTQQAAEEPRLCHQTHTCHLIPLRSELPPGLSWRRSLRPHRHRQSHPWAEWLHRETYLCPETVTLWGQGDREAPAGEGADEKVKSATAGGEGGTPGS